MCRLGIEIMSIIVFTLAVVVVDIGRRCSHLQGQAIGSLERVAVPDQEGSWLSLFQSCDRYKQPKC